MFIYSRVKKISKKGKIRLGQRAEIFITEYQPFCIINSFVQHPNYF